MMRVGRRLAIVAAGSTTLLVTWPLARCLETCLGRPPDTLVSLYFLHWVAHALTTPGVRVLDAPMFAPYRDTLLLGEYVPAYVPVALLALQLTGNPVVAHNVVLLALYAMTAIGATVLALDVLGTTGPALVVGLGFAYSPRLLDQAYNLQTLSIAWIPWLFLALERFLDQASWAAASGLAMLTIGLALSSLNMLAFAGIGVAVFMATAVFDRERRLQRTHFVRLAVVTAPMLGVLVAYVWPYARVARAWGLSRTLVEVQQGSARLSGYAQWPPEPLVNRLFHLDGSSPAQSLLPGLTVGVLMILGFVALHRPSPLRFRLRPYVAVAGAAFVLALGPTLSTRWGSLPLPYWLLYRVVPGFDAIRTPARLVLVGDLGVALLTGAGLIVLLARTPRRGRSLTVVGVALAVLAESVWVPFPGAVTRLDARALPQVYRWLGTQPSTTVALGVPMGDWVNVAGVAFHLRRVVNGWASYDPPRYAELVEAMRAFPDARTLTLIRGIRPDVVLVDREWLTATREAALSRFGGDLHLERRFPTHLVYRVTGALPAGPEALEASLRVERAASPGRVRTCVVLRNPGPDFIPLYPVRHLRVDLRDELEAHLAGAEGWLPLDLAPNVEHATCVTVAEERGKARQVRGMLDGVGGRLHTFRITAGDPPRPLATLLEPPE